MNGTLALTYDDGPDPRWTEPLLALLRESAAPRSSPSRRARRRIPP
ncbi:MAG: hypothetical protein U0R71_12030 [Solirubrobacterales bacterium]